MSSASDGGKSLRPTSVARVDILLQCRLRAHKRADRGAGASGERSISRSVAAIEDIV